MSTMAKKIRLGNAVFALAGLLAIVLGLNRYEQAVWALVVAMVAGVLLSSGIELACGAKRGPGGSEDLDRAGGRYDHLHAGRKPSH